MDLTLVVGSKTVSSWSLRPWFLMKQAEIPFQEIVIPLHHSTTRERILQHSPSGRVPVLIHNKVQVWDSLAIAEYLHELFPAKGLWPRAMEERALARSICAEMHSGFAAMREQLSMDVTRSLPTPPLTEATRKDLNRVFTIWTECLDRSDGPFLFGREATIADAMFAPVTTRMKTYSIPLSGAPLRYVETISSLPTMQEWIRQAHGEPQK